MKNHKYFGIIIVFVIGIGFPKPPLIDGSVPLQSLTMTPVPSSQPTTAPNGLDLLPTIQNLMLDDKECQYPCFWSFEPEQTTMEEVETFLHKNLNSGLSSGQTKRSDGVVNRSLILNFSSDFPFRGMAINFTFTDDVLTLLHLDLLYPEKWLPDNKFRVSNLLNQDIIFDEAYIGIKSGDIGLILRSQDKEVTAEYLFSLRVQGNVISPNVDKPLLLCPTPDLNTYTSLWLQNKSADKPFDILSSNSTLPNSSVTFYQPIKWMTGLETADFIKHMIDNPDECIEMISYPELLRRGYGF